MATLTQATAPTAKMTFEEFLDWAIRENVHAEWVNGEVEIMSPASLRHRDIAFFIARILAEFAEDNQSGHVTNEFMMKLPVIPSGREPDVLFISAENEHHAQPNHLESPADIAVEVVSPDSVVRDRQVKLREYESAGVREYWLIDPLQNEAIFYQLQTDGTYQIASVDANGIYRSKVLDGFWMDVNWLWQQPLPTLRSVRAALNIAE